MAPSPPGHGLGARVESEPYRDYPRWDRKRIYHTVIELFRRKTLGEGFYIW